MKLTKKILILGLLITVVFSACKKDENELLPPKKEAPKVSINAKTSGNVIDVPQAAYSANEGQFNMVASNINQVGTFIAFLNAIPKDATAISIRGTNSTTVYYWAVTQSNATVKYWYTVTENATDYDIIYEFSYSSADVNIARTTYMTGTISKDGKKGHLLLNYEALTRGNTTFNYTYDWDTNAAGDLHILAYWNIENSYYTNIVYEATVYASGKGVAEYKYTEGDDKIVWHYEWNADWSVITWTYTVNGDLDSDMSGEWTA